MYVYAVNVNVPVVPGIDPGATMLFTTTPEATTTVIEQIRRDHGQRPATFTDVTPSAAPKPSARTRAWLGYRLRPVAAA